MDAPDTSLRTIVLALNYGVIRFEEVANTEVGTPESFLINETMLAILAIEGRREMPRDAVLDVIVEFVGALEQSGLPEDAVDRVRNAHAELRSIWG